MTILRVFIFAFGLFACSVGAANAQMFFVIPNYPQAFPRSLKGDYQNIHTVAVISALGDHISLHLNDFWHAKNKTIDLQSWKIDDDIEAQLKNRLSPRFAVKDVRIDRSALAKVPNGQLDNYLSGFSGFLQTLPQDGIDAYLVVRPDLEYRMPGIEGLGLEIGRDGSVLWANYEIDLVDARSRKIIAKAYSRLHAQNGDGISYAAVTMAAVLADSDLNVSDNNAVMLRRSLSSLIRASLVETIRDIDLGIDLPLPGARELVPIPDDENPYRNYKTVAIASGVGDILDLEHVGDAPPTQGGHTIPISDWLLDNRMEENARAVLAGKYVVRTAPVDHLAFGNARIWDEQGRYSPSFPGIGPLPDTDLYVVMVKLSQKVPPTLEHGTGVGVFHLNLGGITTSAFANYAVAVLDAHTMKVLIARPAILAPNKASDSPIQQLSNSDWPAAPTEMMPSQATDIRAAFSALLDNSENETISRLGITGLMSYAEGPPIISSEFH
jgi:hypothetical protein